MNRAYDMPFGAQVVGERETRFRLWAPGARTVELCLVDADSESLFAMEELADGWRELVTNAPTGTRYRFRIDGDLRVPDPASRFQPDDVHGPSEVIDPRRYTWNDGAWRGRPWDETVLYELHVGSFTPEGTFAGVASRLDHLVELGVTAVELMPIADFPGARNWGYDGVLPFAPDHRYGRPDDLRALVDAAHARGLLMFLDVVYNHFGPEGNYLHAYAPAFFTDRHHTPWGAAINLDGERSETVRDFFVHNALYWLEEFHFDGLRLDAKHALLDDSDPDFITELAERVTAGPGASREVHLVLENDGNEARYLGRDERGRPRWYAAQWNDDVHHALHVLTTHETGGYYADFAADPAGLLARALTEGFAFQGDVSEYRGGRRRGEPTTDLPDAAFVSFLQNHDQVGNRAFGERITALATAPAVRAATAIVLLAPQPPMLFMGQEWGAAQPFPFFCDFGGDLANAVTEGRRREFARFPMFAEQAARAHIPDPNDPATFAAAILRWHELDNAPHSEWLTLHRELLAIRTRVVVPFARQLAPRSAASRRLGDRALEIRWRSSNNDSTLHLLANLSDEPVSGIEAPTGELLFAATGTAQGAAAAGVLDPWAVLWHLTHATNA